MAIKTFTTGEVLTASDTNTYLNNGGLVYLGVSTFSGATNNLTGIFSSTYDSYKIILKDVSIGVGGGYFTARMLNGTTPLNTATYYSAANGFNSNGASANLSAAGATVAYIQQAFNAAQTGNGAAGIVLDIINPFNAKATIIQSSATNYSTTYYWTYNGMCAVDNVNQYDGIQFLERNGTIAVGATARIYGYRQA